MKEPANHRGALGDLYDDLQSYRKADFDLEQTVQAVLIAVRRTCANQQLADPTPAQEQAAADLVRALWGCWNFWINPRPPARIHPADWQEAQVAEEEKRADPHPPSEGDPKGQLYRPEH